MPDEEKTEDPTPKRRQEARKEGQVAQSKELNSALTLLFSFIIFYFTMSKMIKEIIEFLTKVYTQYFTMQLSAHNFHTLFIEIMFFILKLVAPIMIGVAAIGVLAIYLQIGFLFTTKPLKPSFSKLNPIEGFKQLFSKRSVVELIKSLFKIGVIGYICYITIAGIVPELVLLTQGGVEIALNLLADTAYSLGMRVSAAFIILGIADLFYQKWEHTQQLKMSKKEVEDEQKEQDGNPEVKSERQKRQQEMAQSRMMQDVPDADVVITNPTHIAVALKFDIETMEAPVVVAMGQDEVARKIKEVAKEYEIEIVEEKPLARALYKMVDIGDQIPAELYQAVAGILAYVYKLDRKV
ncbi:flagellar biosynthetic protein FlhB [Halobacteroides halobius DSM 5150]|uniref:Flagellar biosynthetic protein FlhB n=1 Tax=Halobacteroides halobius (strain ATCC 35273 / DSM 5150 / MD-1) TaxID=748449 RepID=U3GM94_HALHC|nr:flagellar biosynthesis protein FlhB [Halobacteroides halobius]AGB40645.1 flagellar biosynthetic protein FlhB [Halobacteroides halobius DSM 5150]